MRVAYAEERRRLALVRLARSARVRDKGERGAGDPMWDALEYCIDHIPASAELQLRDLAQDLRGKAEVPGLRGGRPVNTRCGGARGGRAGGLAQ